MTTPKVKTDGSRVVVEADSAATARELAAGLKHQANAMEGGLAGWLDNLFNRIGGVFDVAGQRIFEVLAWVLLIVAAYYAFASFSRIFPQEAALAWGGGAVGVVMSVGAKLMAGRWAKANVRCDRDAAKAYKLGAIACVIALVLVGAAFQASVSEDQDSGRIDTQLEIEAIGREIRELGYELEDMRRNPLYSEFDQDALATDLRRAVSRPAYNSNGVNTGRPIGDFVGLGTEDFCAGTSWYVERYCPDLLVLEDRLKYRIAYDEKAARRAALDAEIAALQAARPAKSSIMAFVEETAIGETRWGAFLGAAAFLAFVDILMIGFAYMATWSRLRPEGEPQL